MFDLEFDPAGNLGPLIASFVKEVADENALIAAASDRKSVIFQRAKDSGLDVRALKRVIRELSKDPEKRQKDAETAVVVDDYLRALGVDPEKLRSQGISPLQALTGQYESPSDLPRDLSAQI